MNTDGLPWSPSALNCRFARLRLALGRRKLDELGLTPPKLKRLTKAQRGDDAVRARHREAVGRAAASDRRIGPPPRPALFPVHIPAFLVHSRPRARGRCGDGGHADGPPGYHDDFASLRPPDAASRPPAGVGQESRRCLRRRRGAGAGGATLGSAACRYSASCSSLIRMTPRPSPIRLHAQLSSRDQAVDGAGADLELSCHIANPQNHPPFRPSLTNPSITNRDGPPPRRVILLPDTYRSRPACTASRRPSGTGRSSPPSIERPGPLLIIPVLANITSPASACSWAAAPVSRLSTMMTAAYSANSKTNPNSPDRS